MKNRAAVASILLVNGILLIVGLLFPLLSKRTFLPWQISLLGSHVMLFLFLLALVGLHRLQDGADGYRGRVASRLIVSSIPLYVVVAVLSALAITMYSPEVNRSLRPFALPDTDGILSPGFLPITVAIIIFDITAGLVVIGGIVLLAIGMTLGKVPHATPLWIFLGGIAAQVFVLSPMFDLRDLPPPGYVIAGVAMVFLGIRVWRHPRPDAADEADPAEAAAAWAQIQGP